MYFLMFLGEGGVDRRMWDRVETISREEMNALQTERLRNCVAHVSVNVPLYRERLAAVGVGPGDICSLDDLGRLPFTIKQDLRDSYPYGLFAVPMSEVVRLHASSGTTGKMTVVGYTTNDIAMWADLAARALSIAGADRDDIVHVAYGYGLFTGRARSAQRRRASWRDGGAGLGGQHAAAGGAGAGLRGDRAVLHPVVFAAHRRAGGRGPGGSWQDEAGSVGRRAVVGGDARGN